MEMAEIIHDSMNNVDIQSARYVSYTCKWVFRVLPRHPYDTIPDIRMFI